MVALDCGAKTAQVVLVIVNTLFLLFGMGMAIAGLIFRFGGDMMEDDIRKILKEIHLDVAGGNDTYEVANSLATFFIVLGFIIFLIGFLGCVGACCQFQWMLVIYAILVMIILIAQIAVIILFAVFRNEIDDDFKKAMKDLFDDKYGKDQDFTNSFNAMFKSLQCCGIESSTDVSLVVLPDQCCASKPCTTLNAYPGCYQTLESYFSRYNGVFIGVGVAVLLFQLLCIVFAFCLCSAIRRDGVNKSV